MSDTDKEKNPPKQVKGSSPKTESPERDVSSTETTSQHQLRQSPEEGEITKTDSEIETRRESQDVLMANEVIVLDA